MLPAGNLHIVYEFGNSCADSYSLDQIDNGRYEVIHIRL